MITELVLKFFVPSIYTKKDVLAEFQRNVHGFHALDIYRRSRLFTSTMESSEPDPIKNFTVMRSAIRLHEAGITFKQSKSSSLTSIRFDESRGILTLPSITVDDNSECEFLNMVALEHLHAECRDEISSYVAFMDALVDSNEDVQLLHRHRLVNNGVGSDEDFARLFSSMSREVIVDLGGSLRSEQDAVENYCKKKYSRWKAELAHTYFRNPWTLFSVIAAAFVIFLTIVSTIVSIFQWKKV